MDLESNGESLSALTSCSEITEYQEDKDLVQLKSRAEELNNLIRSGRSQLESIHVQLYKYEKEKESLKRKLKKIDPSSSIDVEILDLKNVIVNPSSTVAEKNGRKKTNGRKKPVRLDRTDRMLLLRDFESKEFTRQELIEKYQISNFTFYGITSGLEVPRNNSDISKPNSIQDGSQLRGRRSQLTTDHIGALLYELENSQEMGYSIVDLKIFVQEHFQISVDGNTILKNLFKLHTLWKTTTTIPHYWNTSEVLEQRKAFVTNLVKFERRCAFYLDVFTTNLDQKVNYGWALRGKPSASVIQEQVHLIAAISLNKIPTLHHCVQGNLVTHDHLKRFLLDNLEIFKGQVLFLDDAYYHQKLFHDSELLFKLREFDIVYQFLPLYSPFLNPTEYFFNRIHLCLKHSTFQTKQELVNLITYFVQQMSDHEVLEEFLTKAKLYNDSILQSLPVNGFILDDPEQSYQKQNPGQ